MASKESEFRKSIPGYLFAAYSILISGCAYQPPNYAPMLIGKNSGFGAAVNFPPTYLIYDGNASDTFLGAQKNVRINSITSVDFHFKNEDFHFSPSVYFLGFGLGVGYLYKDITAVSVNGGLSIAPVSRSYGFQITQKVYDKTYLTYGLNRADFNGINCNGICVEQDSAVAGNYHHFSLGYFFLDRIFMELRGDYSHGKIDDFSKGVSLTFYHEFNKGK